MSGLLPIFIISRVAFSHTSSIAHAQCRYRVLRHVYSCPLPLSTSTSSSTCGTRLFVSFALIPNYGYILCPVDCYAIIDKRCQWLQFYNQISGKNTVTESETTDSIGQ